MTLLHTEKVHEASALVPEAWKSVFSTPSGFMITHSNRRSGVTPGGKTWSRFQEQSVDFYSMKSGKLVIYRKERITPARNYGQPRGRSRMGPVRDWTSRSLLAYGVNFSTSLHDVGAKHLGFQGYSELIQKEFPLAADIQAGVPSSTNLLRYSSLVDMSRHLMGKHYQKGVPRAFAQVTDNAAPTIRRSFLELSMIFKGVIPTDWLVGLYQESPTHYYPNLFSHRDTLRDMRVFLRTANETQLRRLVRNPTPRFAAHFRDTYRSIDTLEGVDFRSMQDLHDNLYRRNYDLGHVRQQAPAKVIEYKGKARKFLGEQDGFTIIAPEDTSVLYGWSNTMGNCISGYGFQAAAGNTLLYAVMREDKMVANMELEPKTGTVRQLLGKYNQSLDPALSSSIKSRVLSVWPKANVNSGWE